jgi:hypothetical protein
MRALQTKRERERERERERHGGTEVPALRPKAYMAVEEGAHHPLAAHHLQAASSQSDTYKPGPAQLVT